MKDQIDLSNEQVNSIEALFAQMNTTAMELSTKLIEKEGLPLYLQVSRGDCVLHLTEHHGDCCPGAAMRIKTEVLKEFHQELHQKNPKYGPGIEKMPWGTNDMSVKDPFGNRLTFCSDIST